MSTVVFVYCPCCTIQLRLWEAIYSLERCSNCRITWKSTRGFETAEEVKKAHPSLLKTYSPKAKGRVPTTIFKVHCWLCWLAPKISHLTSWGTQPLDVLKNWTRGHFVSTNLQPLLKSKCCRLVHDFSWQQNISEYPEKPQYEPPAKMMVLDSNKEHGRFWCYKLQILKKHVYHFNCTSFSSPERFLSNRTGSKYWKHMVKLSICSGPAQLAQRSPNVAATMPL